MKRILGCLLILFWMPGIGSAASTSFNGSFTALSSAYWTSQAAPADSQLSSRGELSFSWESHRIATVISGQGRLAGESEGDSEIRLKEGYLDLSSEFLSLRMGQQILNWGAGHFYSPNDGVNPRDYLYPIEPSKWGVPLLKVSGILQEMTLDFIWIPFPLQSRFPIDTNDAGIIPYRWAPQAARASDTRIERSASEKWKFQQMEMGSRLSAEKEVIRASLYYFAGFDPFPDLRLTSPDESVGKGVRVPTFHRIQRFGADFTFTIGGAEIWTEGAYILTEDMEEHEPNIPGPHAQVVIGTKLAAADLLFQEDDASLLMEYSKKAGEDLGRGPIQFDHFYEDTGISELIYSIGKRWALSLRGALALQYFDGFIQPEVSYHLGEALEVAMGAQNIFGNSQGPFGEFTQNSRAYATLTYAF
ncbi:MAG: hypothetical protein HY391_04000 [Deltaproteobacteria bacterium]|nr:hypothetical protein [Deltaproteobacteria bacterium]